MAESNEDNGNLDKEFNSKSFFTEENQKDQKSENKVHAEEHMDENDNRSSPKEKFDGNSKEIKDKNSDESKPGNNCEQTGKENLKDKKSENNAEGKMDGNDNESSSNKKSDENGEELQDSNSDKSRNSQEQTEKENLKGQELENKANAEGKMDENDNESSPNKKSDGISEKIKGNNLDKSRNNCKQTGRENQEDEKPGNNAAGKMDGNDQKVQTLSPKVKDYIRAHPDLIKKLKSAFEEIESLNQAKNLILKIKKCVCDPVKFLDAYDMKVMYPKNSEKDWLKTNGQEWKNFIDSLQNDFDCVIFCDEDFSKTFVCYTTAKSDSICSKITEFLDPSPIDAPIPPHVMEFVKHNEKFSHLQVESKAQEGIWIRNIGKAELEKLKKEMRKVSCQSYLIDDNQYELLCGEYQGIFSDIGKDFHVIGRPYQLKVVGDIPVVFQVDQLKNISCVVNSNPESIPVDSLISIDWKEPQSTLGLKIVAKERKDNCKILVNDSWNLPMNHHIILSMPGIEKKETSYSWDYLLDVCIKKVCENGMSPHTIGISIPTEISKHLVDFCRTILTAVKNFPPNDKRPIYILLFVQTPEMMENVIELMKKFSASKSDENVPGSKGAIQKRKTVTPEQNEVKDIKKIYNQLYWIPFFNYSTKTGILNDAIREFEKKLKNDMFPVNDNELQDLFFFYDLIKLVPDILQQMKLKPNSILVPKNSSREFKKHLTKLRNQYTKAVFHISKDMDISDIELCLIKIRQSYPNVKCEIANQNQDVLFVASNFDRVQEAKYLFESFLGLRENISSSPDRFKTNEPVPSDYYGATSHASSAPEPPRSQALASNSNENKDIKCFWAQKNLLVKVYEGNILDVDVDGIVNAANRYLSHGAGVARAILNAAGDSINSEARSKLGSGSLNEGEVLSTSAGNLKRYKYIIHAVGPSYSRSAPKTDADYERKVAEAVYNSLDEANRLGLTSIALPAISSALFGVPIKICTDGYFLGVDDFSKKMSPNCTLKEVHFVDLNSTTCKAIEDCFARKMNRVPMEIASGNTKQPIDNQRKPGDSTENDKTCPVCLEEMSRLNLLPCQHGCCRECEKKLPQKLCPICRLPFGVIYGDQPDGEMSFYEENSSLPGFSGTKTYNIKYNMGRWFKSTRREAFLPKNKKGDVILKMLQLAFKRRLIFTVGESRTSGAQNAITWNEIHHKTSRHGGPSNYGYPDPDYFKRVTKELADKGITPDLVANETIKNFIKISSGKVVS